MIRRIEGLPKSDTMTSSNTVVRDAGSDDSGDVADRMGDWRFNVRRHIPADGAATASRDAEGSLRVQAPVDVGRCCVVARQELVRTALRPIIHTGRADSRLRTGETLWSADIIALRNK